MANSVAANTAWEVEISGSDTVNSGGFVYGLFISPPFFSGSNLSTISGGSLSVATYYFVITYSNGGNPAAGYDTIISSEANITTTSTNKTILISSPPIPPNSGASKWSLFVSTTTGGPYWPQQQNITIGSSATNITSTPATSGTQPRGVDYSKQTSYQYTDSSASTDGTHGYITTTITVSGDIVGNYALFNGSYYYIIGVGTNQILLNVTPASSGGSKTLYIGGAFASPGQAFSVSSGSNPPSNIIFIKSGTYQIGTGTQNTAGNKFSTTSGQQLIGYSTNRYPGNMDIGPTFNANGSSINPVVEGNGNYTYLYNFNINNTNISLLYTSVGNINSTSTAYSVGLPSSFTVGIAATINSSSIVSGIGIAPWNSVTGFQGQGTGKVKFMSIMNCATSINSNSGNIWYEDCWDLNCGGMTINTNSNVFRRYISIGCNSSSIGSQAIGANSNTNQNILFDECAIINAISPYAMKVGMNNMVKNCIIYSNIASINTAIFIQGENNTLENIIIQGYNGSGGVGFGLPSTYVQGAANLYYNCATYNAVFDSRIPSYQQINCITLSGSPFNNPSRNDFSLSGPNGALCVAAGIPGSFNGLSTIGYRDIGIAQSAPWIGMVVSEANVSGVYSTSSSSSVTGSNMRGGFVN